ncbi:hypothetical protein EDB80DRAFT_711245 [Ilyonectria destructans]|nr:hypothetical protein EDB80DRAFT_711245 [Ilyonectria destructans]
METAFFEAQDLFTSQLSEKERDEYCNSKIHSIDDVKDTIKKAKLKYESKSTSSARKWIGKFSSLVSYYGNIMDVLIQHHPEYVSLAWGAMKFLFIGVMNHEEKICRLSKAYAMIAETLPRTQLCLVLYPTDDMKTAVTRIYAQIMAFTQAALCWYKQGRIQHAWNSIAKPWALSFEDYIKNIDEQSRRIDAISSMALKAEVREAHIEIRETRKELNETRLAVTRLEDIVQASAQQTLEVALVIKSLQQSMSVEIQDSAGRIRQIQTGQILSNPIFQRFPSSGECFEYCKSLRLRRRSRSSFDLPGLDQLRDWSTQKTSSFLIMNTRNSSLAKDFMVDLIGVICESKSPIVWALRFENHWENGLTKIDILRMLVAHALQVNPTAVDRGSHPITVESLRDASGEKDWLNLLQRAVKGMPQVFIALDADILSRATENNRFLATRWLESIVSSMGDTVIKCIVSSPGLDQSYMDRNWPKEFWVAAEVVDRTLRSHRQSGASRGQARTVRRRNRRRII